MTPAAVFIRLSLLACLCACAGAVTTEIIRPVRATGEDVAVIFVPGALLKGWQYNKTARAIQEASELRVWVVLTGHYLADLPNPVQVPRGINASIKALKQAGFKGENFVGAAHSLGAVVLERYVRLSPAASKIKAVVLMAAEVNRDTTLDRYPVPVMTLSAELDGQMRITRSVESYEQLQSLAAASPRALYRSPVINILGANHAQFATGPMPPRVKKFNPEPDVTEAEAHAAIGKYVDSFLTVTFSLVAASVGKAKKQLENDYAESGKIFQPLIDVKALHREGNSSPWVRMLQEYIAEELADRIETKSTIFESSGFLRSKPTIAKEGNKARINTTASITYERGAEGKPATKQSPEVLSFKMKSKPAIRKALGGINATSDNDPSRPTCQSLNQLALKVALMSSSAEARQRYVSRGRRVTFEQDVVTTTSKAWDATPLKYSLDRFGLTVESPALVMSTESPVLPGDFYCKGVAPYRAMEWVLLDSLMPEPSL